MFEIFSEFTRTAQELWTNYTRKQRPKSRQKKSTSSRNRLPAAPLPPPPDNNPVDIDDIDDIDRLLNTRDDDDDTNQAQVQAEETEQETGASNTPMLNAKATAFDTHLVSSSTTLLVCFYAAANIGLPVCLSDFHRLTLEGKFPLVNLVKDLPEADVAKLLADYDSRFSFRVSYREILL